MYEKQKRRYRMQQNYKYDMSNMSEIEYLGEFSFYKKSEKIIKEKKKVI